MEVVVGCLLVAALCQTYINRNLQRRVKWLEDKSYAEYVRKFIK